jgi:hypothetical protein
LELAEQVAALTVGLVEQAARHHLALYSHHLVVAVDLVLRQLHQSMAAVAAVVFYPLVRLALVMP